MKKAIFKFNNGNDALLCSKCHTILKVGYEFTEKEKKAIKGEVKLKAQYCEKCALKIKAKKLTITIIKENKNAFTGWINEIKGVIAQGNTKKEVKKELLKILQIKFDIEIKNK